ncbi:MAG TPA: type II secretion system F family protein [Planctomycetaceae bacterium]|nr:type II secretion system F family protein [Planctomycetaceae bacterium]HQZ67023.1 type II secretion system F family protein [Planctomycetaceae bacterium]
MDLETVLPVIAFIAITTGLWGVWTLFNKKSSRAAERLEEWRDPFARQKRESGVGGGAASVGSMFEKAAPVLSKALGSKSELEQSNLKIRLANAGFIRPEASRNFLAIKMVSLGLGLFLGATYGFATAGFSKDSWMSLVIGGGMGFYVPELVLTIMKMSRQQKIFLQLPDALDLLVVCVEAGLGLDAGMRRVSEELATGAPEVCSEMATANMQLQMGKPRRDVLHDLGIRTGVDDMRALAAILIQADRFGSSIAQALRVQSDSMRVKRRQMAEEKAAKTAVKMIFPLVLFIFPGIFVVLVGPAAIQLMENMLNN